MDEAARLRFITRMLYSRAWYITHSMPSSASLIVPVPLAASTRTS